MTDGPGFVHLRVHSAYSLLEGAVHLGDLVKLAVADGQPALAVTDRGNLFGALEFSEKAATQGVQPIIGCEIAVALAAEAEGAPAPREQALDRIVCLAATESGLRNLIGLVSRSYLSVSAAHTAHVTADDLRTYAGGIIALSGGLGGPVGRALAAGNEPLAAAAFDSLLAIFGDRLYCELQRHGLQEERQIEAAMVDLAYARGVPLVATNDVHFAARDDFEAHDALICVADGRRLSEDGRRRLTPEHYFKSRAEMRALFEDLPEAVDSTVEIARRCHVRVQKLQPQLPRFAKPATAEADASTDAAGADTAADVLADPVAAEAALLDRMAEEGLRRRLAVKGLAPGTVEADYWSRLAGELRIIREMQYPGYFLIVADFIRWAKEAGIPVGPGRGSGAGSLVAYALTITDLDPLRFGLLFERFLNPERVSMPDFDIDFCQDRRDEVIDYVQEKYGTDRVAQIITFGTLQARAVLRDVGRVLELPYGKVDRLAKMVPNNPANPVTLRAAIDGEPRLQEARDSEAVVDRLLTTAMKLEGLYRHASTHAAGIVIGDRPLDELVPLYRDPRSGMPVTQYNMKWVESAGLVKFDFLGLKTLTVIDRALALVRRKGVTIDLETLPLDDEATYAMLSRGETVGVFQLESAGMRKALIGMRPDRFEDIIAIVALYRPGPMDNIPTYNHRKHDEEKPDYLHERLEPILKETFGVIIYQEQVMQIAQVLSGYSLGEADLLRRAMGKKIREEMAVQRERFVSGAVERGVDKGRASTIFDLVAKFADYGFNKSHAAAYALVAYQTAWLKANHPVEFLAASMTLDAGNTDKLNDFRREAMRLDIDVVAPSISRSTTTFEVDAGKIIYSLTAIKGVGRPLVEHLVALRAERPFDGLADFSHRIDPRIANRRGLEALVAAGAFDEWEPNRARLMAGLDAVVAVAQRVSEGLAVGQSDFFGGSGPEPIQLPDVPPWLPAETLQREHAVVGFYLSAHPLDEYRPVLEKLRVRMWNAFVDDVKERGVSAGRLAGTVNARQERRTKSGSRMAVVKLSDPTGQYEAVVFSDGLAAFGDMLEPGAALLLVVNAEEREDGLSVRVQSVEALDQAALKLSRMMRIFLKEPAPIDSIRRILKEPGKSEVSMVLMLEDGRREVEVRLPQTFTVTPPIASAVKAIPGVIEVEYA